MPTLPGLDLRDGVQALVRSYAAADLSLLWRQVSNAAEAEVALRDILPGLIQTYGSAAAVLAANWYDEARAKAGVGGSFTAIPADFEDVGAQSLVGWAKSQATDLSAFEALILGGMQRRIANYSRSTVSGSSVADPKARGWQRTGSGECEFCRLLIGRGAVYTESTADFASHDNCNCSAVPSWAGQPIPVRPYTPGPRQGNEADYARAREWIATH